MPITSSPTTCLPAGTGRSYALMGSSLTFKNDPADVDAAFFAFEHRMPEGLGVPPHRERNHETFYVLEGTLDVEAGENRYRLGPGDVLAVAPGTIHALHNPGRGVMRVLTVVAPGAGHERFFSTVGEPIDDLANPPPPVAEPDLEHIARVAGDCGIEFLPPPGA
jgi:mannose-6-phosphate isomerase-like protein (cupin superfamily)